MSFSYALLQMPPFVLLMLTLLLFTALSAGGTWFFKKYIRVRYLRAHNEVVGYVFSVVGGFYGLLLGFVVFFVWDALNQAQADASREGSLARAFYRDIRYFPDTVETKPLMDSYLKYVDFVVDEEYPTMERLEPLGALSRATFNDVFRQMELLYVHEPKVEPMFSNLNELATYRSLRQTDASAEIPVEIWVPLLLGGLITMLFATMINMQSTRLHIMVNGLLGAFIGLVFFIILILDHPFTGQIKIEPTEYGIIKKMGKSGE